MGPLYPTCEAQWTMHRALITQMYQKEKQTLKNVMELMAREHAFRATMKMYKIRLKAWGLDKKNKRHEMKAILRKSFQRRSKGKASIFFLRGRLVDLDDVERYRKRNSLTLDGFKAQGISSPGTPKDLVCLTPPRLQSPLSCTGGMRGADEFFQNIATYFKGAFDRSPLKPNDGSRKSSGFPNLHTTSDLIPMTAMTSSLRCGIAAFQRGHCREAGRYWSHAFIQAKSLVLSWNAYAAANLLEQLITLENCGCLEVATLLRQQIAEMAKVVLPSTDPRHVIYTSLASFQQDTLQDMEHRIRPLFLNLVSSIFGEASLVAFHARLEHEYIILRKDPTTPLDKVFSPIQQLDRAFGMYGRTVEAISYRVQILYERKRYAEAEEMACIYLDRALRMEPGRVRNVRQCMAWYRLGKCQYMLYKDRAATRSLEKAVAAHQQCLKNTGTGILLGYDLLSAIGKLEALTESAGKSPAAAEWRRLQAESLEQLTTAEGQ